MMERVDTLLKKINEQFAQKANINDMLITCKMIQQELVFVQQQQPHGSVQCQQIAVTILPSFNPTPVAELTTLPRPENVQTAEIQPITNVDVTEELNHSVSEMHLVKNAAVPEGEAKVLKVLEVDEANIVAELEALKRDKEQIEHIAANSKLKVADLEIEPTTTELNDALVAQGAPSLNDKLKQANLNLGDTLVEAPVKDLRKAIGINDKFLYINELFRGDEAMYERSIKTINGFSILPEAEYWIQRELKVKIGWKEDSETVQQFNQLIKRRFS